MSKVRVIRLLEYTYDSFESAERDMQNWHVPASGSVVLLNGSEVVRSSVIIRPEED